jgi:hypothetical protein
MSKKIVNELFDTPGYEGKEKIFAKYQLKPLSNNLAGGDAATVMKKGYA